MKAKKSGTIGIIGGGLGGLAAACTLAARGYQVVLFEANPWLGGKAAELSEHGFRFDMCSPPTLPSVLRRIFEEAGRRMGDYLEMVRLEPQWRSFFEDGTTLDLVSDAAVMAQNLDRLAPAAKSAQVIASFKGSPNGSTISRNVSSSTNPLAAWVTCSMRRTLSMLQL